MHTMVQHVQLNTRYNLLVQSCQFRAIILSNAMNEPPDGNENHNTYQDHRIPYPSQHLQMSDGDSTHNSSEISDRQDMRMESRT